uniref:GTP-dependent dephospho-CoA kinase n=1 Tax=Candidatus Aramenus sulfurataquae TaxID=1326980 RepID=A0A0F2LQ04_9CREN
MEIRNKPEVDLCFEVPRELRKELSRPYGILFTKVVSLLNFLEGKRRVITIGDVVTETLLENDFSPFIAVVDGKTKRTISTGQKVKPSFFVKNEPGLLRLESIKLVERLLNSETPSVLFVDGEEDLFVIPFVIYGRLDDVIVYGQPNAGAVALEVTEAMKWRVEDIFKRFTVKKC